MHVDRIIMSELSSDHHVDDIIMSELSSFVQYRVAIK